MCVKTLVSRPTRSNIEGGRENGNDQNTIFGPNRAEVTRNCIIGNTVIYTLREILLCLSYVRGKEEGRRRKKLLDDLKDRTGYSRLKDEVPDRTMWRNRFGGGFGPVVRQNTE